MKKRLVNTTIQIQKRRAPSVHYMIAPQFNYKLTAPPHFTFVNLFTGQGLIAGWTCCNIFVPARTSSFTECHVAGFCCCIWNFRCLLPCTHVIAGEIYYYCLFFDLTKFSGKYRLVLTLPEEHVRTVDTKTKTDSTCKQHLSTDCH